jgi:hypothetical protein
MFTRTLPIAEARHLPRWRQPTTLLFLMAVAMPLAFATWSALLNNFVIEAAGFTGVEIGWLHTVREIPGLLAVGVLLFLLVIREQVMAGLMLILLGSATAVTAWFPTFGGILIVTFISSVGFHYYESCNQSLQLQWLAKADAPRILGKLVAAGSIASLVAYGLIVLFWKTFDLSFNFVFMASGGLCVLIAVFALLAFPQFEAEHKQRKSIVLRRRYWLYYLFEMLNGARRQIFVVFAAFMMVEHYGYAVHQVTALMLITFVANMVTAPAIGRFVARFGEQKAMLIEFTGLFFVFVGYGCLFWFALPGWVAAVLYVANNIFFAISFSHKTYFQKIADPTDMATSAAVSFTINHIAAVFLPAGLGYIWATSPDYVFILAAGIAFAQILLALLVPRNPSAGNETRLREMRGPGPILTPAE